MNPETIKKDRIWIRLDTFRSLKNEVLDAKISAIFNTCIKPLVAQKYASFDMDRDKNFNEIKVKKIEIKITIKRSLFR